MSSARCISISAVGRRCAAARSDRSRRRRSPSARARSSTAANLIFSLQRRQGFGVRPSAYSLQEVLDDVLVEALAEVPDVEGDADHVGRTARVVGVLDRAAAARAGAVGLRVAREREVDAGDVVARRRPRARPRPPSRRRPTSLPGRASAPLPSERRGWSRPALRARSTTGPMASTSASTSASRRGVAEREAQRRARRLLGGAHREQHVRGLRYAGVAGRARSSTRCRARRAASAASRPRNPGTRRCALPGQPVRRGPASGSPLKTASGTSRSTPATSTSRSLASRCGQLGLPLDRQAGTPPRSPRSPVGRWCRTGCRAPGRRRAAGRSAAAHGVRRARRHRTGRRSCAR